MFGTTNAYMALDAWVLANVVQLATDSFCRRFLTPAVDPCGRQETTTERIGRQLNDVCENPGVKGHIGICCSKHDFSFNCC